MVLPRTLTGKAGGLSTENVELDEKGSPEKKPQKHPKTQKGVYVGNSFLRLLRNVAA
jgi:hypothetical protein